MIARRRAGPRGGSQRHTARSVRRRGRGRAPGTCEPELWTLASGLRLQGAALHRGRRARRKERDAGGRDGRGEPCVRLGSGVLPLGGLLAFEAHPFALRARCRTSAQLGWHHRDPADGTDRRAFIVHGLQPPLPKYASGSGATSAAPVPRKGARTLPAASSRGRRTTLNGFDVCGLCLKKVRPSAGVSGLGLDDLLARVKRRSVCSRGARRLESPLAAPPPRPHPIRELDRPSHAPVGRPARGLVSSGRSFSG
jgi:hypothetical protein